MTKETVYISASMTGKEDFNRDLFCEVEEFLQEEGFDTINPVKLDEEINKEDPTHFDFLKQDLSVIIERADSIALVRDNGGEHFNSKGAGIEHFVATSVGLNRYEVIKDDNGDWQLSDDVMLPVTLQAFSAVLGEKRANYSHPLDNFEFISSLWNAMLSHKLEKELDVQDVALMMMQVKIARQYAQHNIDNLVDLCGYSMTLESCVKEAEQRGKDMDLMSERVRELHANSCDGFEKYEK